MVETKPHFFAVGIDEMEFFNIDEADCPFIEAIIAVYCYDQREHNFLCEGSPSYSLHGVHYSVHLADDTPEYLREDLFEKYGSEYPEDTYMPVWRVEALPGQIDMGELDDDENVRDVIEELQGNWRF
jgi:hypothetical protein